MKKILILSWILLLFASCTDKGREGEPLFPKNVVRQAKGDLAVKEQYLGVDFSSIYEVSTLTPDEKSALTWIYAYSWTPDVMDHTPEFHLNNIRIALKAREELPWGKKVPADQWRHFVLPLRVNNETLDDFRTTYYEELRELVKDLSMEEAVLELNHWAHRHITYEPSDGRTSSPLATLRNALGRCGEQSTLVTAVLRTVGIPARQVYTPRWAHTDDNHAWVEAWVDGTWKYLGASEPAPVLNNAWFDAPVLRAMLLHTKAFGPYTGKEEWLGANDVNTELNVSENYIPVAPAKVVVKDVNGNPVEGATVTFRLYNYAELYPLVTRITNRLGEASLKVGYGDLIVVAGKSNDEMAIGKISVKEGGSTLELTLKHFGELPEEMHFRLTPPIARTPELDISEELSDACNIRKEENNTIRSAYTSTFPTVEDAERLADQIGLKGKARNELIRLFPLSRGYHKEIRDFLLFARDRGKEEQAVSLLGTLKEKDFHDIDIEALKQVIARDLTAEEWREPMIFAPRVMLEHIYPVEPQLEEALRNIKFGKDWNGMSIEEKAREIAREIEAYKVDERYNPAMLPINPASVITHRIGDERSLNILLVRLLRAAHIAAEYDFANSVILYKNERGREEILPFRTKGEDKELEKRKRCWLTLTYTPEGHLKEPKYETHFTVGYVNEGQLVTYQFDYNVPYHKLSGKELLYTDNYLATGVRLADGAVLLSLRKMKCGEATPLLFDRDENSVSVIGGFDSESLYYDLDRGEMKSILSTTGRGYYLLLIGKNHHEPTDHVFRDIHEIRDAEGRFPLPMIALSTRNEAPSAEIRALLPDVVWGEDRNDLRSEIIRGCELSPQSDLPLVVIADTFNRVVFVSHGYTIGIGERIARVIDQIKE